MSRVLLAACGVWFLATSFALAEPPKIDPTKLELASPELVTIRKVTRGPKFHWFGYYDKMQLDASGRYLLAMQTDFEHRSPTADDVIKIGMVDLQDNDRWIELGESRSWSWQQGCMLQWRPGHPTEVLWNDREGDRFVCRILDIKTRKMRTIPSPVYHVRPDGKQAVTPDFRRIQYMRPGYGYPGLDDPYRSELKPSQAGIWLVDLDTGESKLILSLAQAASIPYEGSTPQDKHWFNHLQWSPDGERFIAFNRWSVGEGTRWKTRVFTAAADGSDLRLLAPAGVFSHFEWRDPDSISVWTDGAFKIFADDGSGEAKEIQWVAPDGHQSFIPGTNKEWLVCDSYPRGAKREQTVYLIHPKSGYAVVLGRFPLPDQYRGEWRCDTHPRVSQDGRFVIIDSPHEGDGRQQYLIDIQKVIAQGPPTKK